MSQITFFVALFFGTFFLEDLALGSALILITDGKISYGLGLTSCFLGITIGDLVLYGLGRVLSKYPGLMQNQFLNGVSRRLSAFKDSELIPVSIIFSRFIPGTRAITYILSGFLEYSFLNFLGLTLLTVFIWVFGFLYFGHQLISFLPDNIFLRIAAIVISFVVLKLVLKKLANPWTRRTILSSWRKYLYFEFWPSWFFYIPIVFFYIYFSIKYRSLFLPFYANPHLKNGGLIGESKWDLLQNFEMENEFNLKTFKINKESSPQETLQLIVDNGLNFPIILKPDVGQRGFAVRIVKSPKDLNTYLTSAKFDRILQEFCNFNREAGIFYIRLPNQKKGFIFSITDKMFPFIVGDGTSSLGELILQDPRAKLISNVYFERHKKSLHQIIEKNTKYLLSECGNHCQGAIFKNGEYLITDKLTEQIDRLAKKIPDFCFGRFDLKYQDQDSLMLGKNFKIVEINASGAEATHIWDSQTTLKEAYKVLFQQWEYLFQIGKEMKQKYPEKVELDLSSFFHESISVFFRKGPFNISS